MTAWVVEFVNRTAEAEFEALPKDSQARLVQVLDVIRGNGLVGLGMPYARPVQGKLWELRAQGRDGIARSLYVAASGKRVVILRSFVKKTQATPKQEIRLALARMQEVE